MHAMFSGVEHPEAKHGNKYLKHGYAVDIEGDERIVSALIHM